MGWDDGMPEDVRVKMTATKRAQAAAESAAKGFVEDKKCELCGTLFPRPINSFNDKKVGWAKYQGMRFCSKSCMAQNREREKGNPPSLTPICSWPECGKTCKPVSGKRLLLANHYCSMACLGLFIGQSQKGKNHWNWKGGRTEANALLRHASQYNEWRKAVYQRDRWICQRCFVKQKHPIAHHVKSFKGHPELRYDVANGETMCRSCHLKEHIEIGKSTRFKKGRNKK